MDAGASGDRRPGGLVSGLSQEQLAARYMQQQSGAVGAYGASYTSAAPTVAPVRRLVDRVPGESSGMYYPVSGYTSRQAPAATGQYVVRQEPSHFQELPEGVPAFPGSQGVDFTPTEAMMVYGVVPWCALPLCSALCRFLSIGNVFKNIGNAEVETGADAVCASSVQQRCAAPEGCITARRLEWVQLLRGGSSLQQL